MDDIKDRNGGGDINKPEKSRLKRILRVALIAVSALLLLIVVGVTFLTLYLTPERSTSLFNRYAGKYLKADVEAGFVDFRLWSTFPEFHLDIKDLKVISRVPGFQNPISNNLPAYSDTLMLLSRFEGDINPLALMGGRIKCGVVRFTDLQLNLVTLNDSVANYDIFPDLDTKEAFRIPRFSFKSLALTGKRRIRYYAAPTEAEFMADLSAASMDRLKKPDNTYAMDLKGLFRLVIEGKEILRDFPFGFSGNTLVAFDPFRIRMEKYSVSLGNLRSHLNLSINLDNAGKVSDLHYVTEPVSLLRFLDLLPGEMVPEMLSEVSGDLLVSASLRLTKPYYFSSSSLPSFAVDIDVPGSTLDYKLTSGEKLRFDKIRMNGSLMFNGDEPEKSYVDINRADFSGEGVSVSVSGKVSDIMTDPQVDLHSTLSGDIGHIVDVFRVPGLKASGGLSLLADFSFTLSGLKTYGLNSIRVKGNADLSSVSYQDRLKSLRFDADRMDVLFTNNAYDRASSVIDAFLHVRAVAGSVRGHTPDADIDMRNMMFAGDVKLASSGFDPSVQAQNLLLECKDLDVRSSDNDGLIKAGGVKVSLKSLRAASRMKFMVAVRRFLYASSRAKATLADLNAGVSCRFGSPRSMIVSVMEAMHDTIASANPYISADSVSRLLTRRMPAHTPEYVTADIPHGLRNLLSLWRGNVSFTTSGGLFELAAYPDKIRMSGGDIYFDADSVHLSKVAFRSGNSNIILSGSVSNIKELFSGDRRTPVRVRLDADIDTLNINSLAAAGKKAAAIAPRNHRKEMKGESAAEDRRNTIVPALLVPRNLDAVIRMKAKDTYYTNLHFFDLGTTLRLNRSVFLLDSLYLHSDFGAAYLNLLYSTRDIEDINMSLDLGLDSLDIVRVYEKFQSLQEMMPQLANLSGFVGMKAIASFDVFPDMNIDIPSLKALIEADGWRLKLKQDHFIRAVTRHLFIPNSNDIHIPAVHLKATVHDNLLQVDPFLFSFDNYTLKLMGENDFHGDLYYHVGVLKSPLRIPFGINITGTFSDWHVKFGGSRFKPHNAFKEINLLESRRVSLVAEMRKYLMEFVNKAALSVDNP